MRYAFIKTLTEEAQKNKNIVLLTADLGFTVFEGFKKKFPNRFINVGVAEQNMMSIAAGLSMTGKIVFAYSIATFATMRPFEQIRNDIAGHKLPVIIVGTGSGLSYADNAFTHHSIEDINLMRGIPGMSILSPADPHEVIWATKIAVKLKKPMYLRLGKRGEQNLEKVKPALKFGKARQIKSGTNVAILSTGAITPTAMEVVKLLKVKNISSSLFSIHTIKPFDNKMIKKLCLDHSIIVTIEEHSLIGGLGSTIAELLSENINTIKLLRFGIPDEFIYKIGTQDYLRNIIGLSSTNITKRIIENLN